MTFRIPESGEEWMRQVERRLAIQERRRDATLVGSFVPVMSDEDQAALVGWYRPTSIKPLMIDRVDTVGGPDLRYTKDGLTWWSIDTTAL
jgi:hypothetical protein